MSTANVLASKAIEIERGAPVYRKISLRLLPLLFICYLANVIDRTNIGIAQIQLKHDLGFSEAVYGMGVGLLFVGYIIFEVPSNLIASRIGVRKTLLRIMIVWGIISASMVFIKTPLQFYIVRFLLGVAEAGCMPAILLYLTYWYPSSQRASNTSIFMLSLPAAVLIGSPLSGWIIHSMQGVAGLRGWQWMFLMEGLPTIVLGVLAYFVLADKPQAASWLTAEEKARIAADLAAEQNAKSDRPHTSLRTVLRDPMIYILGLIAFGSYTLGNAVVFWSPLVINASGVKNILNVGLLGAIPPSFGALAMLVTANRSDRMRERRWHAAGAWFAAVTALIGLSLLYAGHPLLTIALLALMSAGHYAGLCVYFTIPSIYFSSAASASGIAIVTAIGAVGAAVSPMILGWIRVQTGNLSLGLQLTGAVVALGALLLLLAVPARALKEAPR